MSNSIFLSNSEIQIVKYSRSGEKMKIKGYISTPLPEGSMINGVITDAQLLIEQLKQLKLKEPSYFDNASLTIDTNSILLKLIAVPSLKKEKYFLIVEDDLKNRLTAYREVFYDFSFWNKKKKEMVILGAGADKASLETYLAVFKEAQIKLNRINVGIESIIRYLEKFNRDREDTYALNIIDNMSMVSLIFEKGAFVFSTRSRIVGESLDQISLSVVQNLSQLVQFNKNIKKSFYIGASDELITKINELPIHAEVERVHFDLKQVTKGLRKIYTSSPFALFGAYANKNYINFIDTFKKSEKAKKKPSRFKLKYLLGFLLPILLIGLYQYFYIQANKMNDENNEVKKYLNSETVIKQKAQIDDYQKEMKQWYEVKKNMDVGIDDFNKISTINSTIVNSIYGTAGSQVTIKSLSFDTVSNSFDINALAKSQLDVSTYGSRLKETNLFSDVQYLGYQGNESNMTFTFKIKAILKAVENTKTE
ncbi:MAG: pilM [Bacillales bacterium]|jgi:Tfp pilus assembly PilM family ATPase|nr:pilM [Bacillales bacterium]